MSVLVAEATKTFLGLVMMVCIWNVGFPLIDFSMEGIDWTVAFLHEWRRGLMLRRRLNHFNK